MGKNNSNQIAASGRFSDHFDKPAFPDVEAKPVGEMLAIDLLVKDVAFKTMNHGDVAILLVRPQAEYFTETGEPEQDYSVLCGGAVVVNRLKEALEGNMLPMMGMITKERSGKGTSYYNIK